MLSSLFCETPLLYEALKQFSLVVSSYADSFGVMCPSLDWFRLLLLSIVRSIECPD